MTAKHQPTAETRAKVKELSGFGLIQKHIAGVIGVSVRTLNTHYSQEIDEGLAEAVGKTANILYDLIHKEKDRAAVFFYLKTRGHYKETLDLSNDDKSFTPRPINDFYQAQDEKADT